MNIDNCFDRMKKCSDMSLFKTNSGCKEVPTYEYKDVDGIKTLVKNGVFNLDEYIQSFAMAQDIHVMIAKFLNGDTSVISNIAGTFGDFRNMPNSYAELFDRVTACNSVFNSLPADIRSKFDNSVEKFWESFGSKYFDDVFKDFSTASNTNINDVKDNVDKGVNENA